MKKQFSDFDEDYDVTEEYDERDFDGIFSECTVCAQCGYRLTENDDAVKVLYTGDVIHRDCLADYCEDNAEALTKRISL